MRTTYLTTNFFLCEQRVPEEPPPKRVAVEEPVVVTTAPPPPLAPPPPEPKKVALRTQLANQLTGNTIKALKRPLYPVRPVAIASKATTVASETSSTLPSYMTRTALMLVFKWLTPTDLVKCALVCKPWSNASVDPSLWKRTDVTSKRLTASCLAGIARRQPETLIMDWTAIAKRQLEWLIARLPQLRELSLQGCSWNGVVALRTCNCPPLTSLDLSFVTGLNDASLREILSPPKDTRPGLIDTKSRLRNLRTLKLSGCEISDVSLRYIVQNIPLLSTLDLSQCFRLTDAGIAQLTAPPATTPSTLTWLDLNGCTMITDAALDHLAKCTGLKYLDLRRTTQITSSAINKFLNAKQDLEISEDKLLKKPST
jgi:F-box/leucine-rich repeat protein 10/11